jgi:aldehyde:ferredoxin oxidoreductase
LYNVRQGMSRADDRLPVRFASEPLDVWRYYADPETGETLRSDEPVRCGAILRDPEAMLDRYYALRGWDQNGVPTPQTLERLSIAQYGK